MFHHTIGKEAEGLGVVPAPKASEGTRNLCLLSPQRSDLESVCLEEGGEGWRCHSRGTGREAKCQGHRPTCCPVSGATEETSWLSYAHWQPWSPNLI